MPDSSIAAETREQFRERVAEVAHDAVFLPPLRDQIRISVYVSEWENIAEAVYTQALHDVLDWFVGHPVASGFDSIVDAEPVEALERLVASLQQFAAERGIELNDQGDKQ